MQAPDICLGLWKLANPYESSWHGVPPKLIRIRGEHELDPTKRPLLFIHGMEYLDPIEVPRDLISPFERQAQLFQEDDWDRFEVLFLHWDSSLKCLRRNIPLRLYHKPDRWLNLLRWRRMYADLVGRADQAAEHLSSFLPKFLLSESQLTVVTHSFGAYVWAQTVKHYFEEHATVANYGHWVNMQPALSHRDFCQDGKFALLPKLYSLGSGRISTWYSNFDMVLATLFVWCSGTLAMGQVGTNCPTVAKINVTQRAREAHGQAILDRPRGCYFSRVADLIKEEVKILRLNAAT